MLACRKKRVLPACALIVLACVLTWNLGNTLESQVAGGEVAGTRELLVHEATLPLRDGQLKFGELLAELAEYVGLDGAPVREYVTATLDVQGLAGQAKLYALESLTHGVLSFEVSDAALIVRIDELKYRGEEKRVRTAIRTFVAGLFPEAAARMAAEFGLRVHKTPGTWVGVGEAVFDHPVVVLVHGVDEPGKVWRSLIPALIENAYTPIEFCYANDGPIVDSAMLLSDELKKLRRQGVRRIVLVGHSMGGLVSREMLTHPDLYAGRGAGHDALPDVTGLIMVGTPNHGSAMARLRFAAEVREQIERALSGDGMLFGGIFDGAGEAKIDLLPHSEFITQLNARPLPSDVRITIIAGNASPVTTGKLRHLTDELKVDHPGFWSESAGDVVDTLDDVVTGLGDGAVTIESTRLNGVEDHVIVDGNHLTIIRNYTAGHDREPPAVPIILDRLRTLFPDQ